MRITESKGWKKSHHSVINNCYSAEGRAVWSKITSKISGSMSLKSLIFNFLGPKSHYDLLNCFQLVFKQGIWRLQKQNDTEVYWPKISLFLNYWGNYERLWRKSVSVKKYKKKAALEDYFWCFHSLTSTLRVVGKILNSSGNRRLRLGFALLLRNLSTLPHVWTWGYGNTENVLNCLVRKRTIIAEKISISKFAQFCTSWLKQIFFIHAHNSLCKNLRIERF